MKACPRCRLLYGNGAIDCIVCEIQLEPFPSVERLFAEDYEQNDRSVK